MMQDQGASEQQPEPADAAGEPVSASGQDAAQEMLEGTDVLAADDIPTAIEQATSIKEQIVELVAPIWERIVEELTQPERFIEISLILIAVLSAKWGSVRLHDVVAKFTAKHDSIQRADNRFFKPLIFGVWSLTIVWTSQIGLEYFYDHAYFLEIASSMLVAWIVIRLVAGFIANREIARIIAFTAWLLAALNILGLLRPFLSYIDSIVLPLGEASPSVLDIVQGVVSFGVLLWLVGAVTRQVDTQVRKVASVPPSARVLIVKTSKIVLIVLAFLLALNSTGVDMTAFAVFGGALGVGIGFGLQKVVGNFISGIILLLDRSIKPGDVIEIGTTYGRINKLAARYTSVITRDGTEFLIPNEDMITQPVVNWSHTNQLVRRRIPVQISYESDLRLAMDLMVKAADKESRVKKIPAPRTLLKGFGADGVDLELRMWIDDPQDGVANIGSAVMLHIWDLFHENNIEFPFPQRVVHIARSGKPSSDDPDGEEAAAAAGA